MCEKIQQYGIREKFRICKAPRANKFLRAATYLQVEFFMKIVDLKDESSVFDVSLVAQVIFLFL